ncbi:MAG: potassium channel family protein [Methylococcales bacterium]|nr:potassium channel family protein [Methylococcales bacterium]
MKIIAILAEALKILKNLLNDLMGKQTLVYLLILAFAVTVASGFILYILDSNIHSLFDGIWFAWVTMTHVGFGDVVPTSFLGRLLSAGLILFGLALFSLFTAILSVTLIGKNMDTWGMTCVKSNRRPAVSRRKKTGFSMSWPACTNAWKRWKNSCRQAPAKMVNSCMSVQAAM